MLAFLSELDCFITKDSPGKFIFGVNGHGYSLGKCHPILLEFPNGVTMSVCVDFRELVQVACKDEKDAGHRNDWTITWERPGDFHKLKLIPKESGILLKTVHSPWGATVSGELPDRIVNVQYGHGYKHIPLRNYSSWSAVHQVN